MLEKKSKNGKSKSKPSKRNYWFLETKLVVIYLRVCSEEVAKGSWGLERQLSECERFCKERGWTVVRIFTDAPASGWSGVDRPQLNEMLRYLHATLNVILVFFDYSRLYRRGALAIIELEKLDKLGIYSVSVCNSDVDCRTAAGRTERRRLLNEAEDFSDSHSEMQRERMRIALLHHHRYLGVARLGYKNVLSPNGKPNIIPDEPGFSLMKDSFMLLGQGTTGPVECLRRMTERGLRSRDGNILRLRAFISLLRNPIYVGKIPSTKYGVQPGIHQACVSEETFERVQRVLSTASSHHR